jgi:ketosteroid isomerase-like protein
MREVANIDTVRSVYSAFGRGDLPGILELLDETIVWITPGSTAVPLSGKRRGIDAVRGFFEQLAQRMTFTVFEAREFLAQGNRVIALVHYEGRDNTTGRPFTAEAAMLWTIGNGRVLRFQEYTDTEALAEAARPGDLQVHRAR